MTEPTVWGIDFGTSNSAVFISRPDGMVLPVRDPASPHGSYSTPSSVVLDGHQTLVGWTAERAKRRRPQGYRSQFKREFGGASSGPGLPSPDELAATVLGYLREQAAKQSGVEPERVVITVPAAWERRQRELMLDAATRAGFDPAVLRLRSEPVAAAAAAFLRDPLDGTATIMVYDLGGGTFDCAVARSSGIGVHVLGAPGGVAHLGGADFDREIITDLGRRFPSCADLLRGPPPDIGVLRRRIALGESAEEIKVQLSVNAAYSAYLTELTPPVETRYTREHLIGLIGPLLEETLVSCEQTLRTVGLGWADIARIIPVGGSTRLPMISELLSTRSGRPVLTVDEPELAVARGAALLALESLLTGDTPADPADVAMTATSCSAINTSPGVGADPSGSRAARLGAIARQAARRATGPQPTPPPRSGVDPAVLARIIAQARRRRGN